MVLVKYGRDFCVESWGHEFYMGGREGGRDIVTITS
jgi:hypothetical protein